MRHASSPTVTLLQRRSRTTQSSRAVPRFEAVVAQAPSDAEAQVGLGQAYLAAGQRWPARKAFERAQQIEPGRKDARQGREAARFQVQPARAAPAPAPARASAPVTS